MRVPIPIPIGEHFQWVTGLQFIYGLRYDQWTDRFDQKAEKKTKTKKKKRTTASSLMLFAILPFVLVVRYVDITWR